MDNNPFRGQQQIGNGNAYMNPSANQASYSQPQYPHQFSQQPSQAGSFYQNPSNLQQQPSQAGGLYQNPSNLQLQPNLGNDSYQNSHMQQQNWPHQGANTYQTPPPSQFSPYIGGTNLPATSFEHNNNASNGLAPYSQTQNTILPAATGYLQQQHMPTPYYSQYSNMQSNMNNPSNMYIPPNFGMSTNVSYEPKHPPVDASTLLKGTQIRRIECPVCQKMLEGDDMAINHHVNEHY